MQRGQIRVVGARQHNLKDVSLTVPRRAITAFTGVSRSGKTSLVFDTIAAEAQRQLNETFTAFVRNRLPRYGRPDVDMIEGLSPVVVINQRRLGGNARSTVGTITDI
jgi:excinuclease UvrABC ATPase subunit